jgi:hypothetical protein
VSVDRRGGTESETNGKRGAAMRFMMLVKSNPSAEAGVLPTAEEIAEMGKYNEALADAGVLLAGEGLQPSSKGARVQFPGGKPTVIDGPFAETKELIAGFWLIHADSLADAVEWAKRAPFREGEIEVRQVFEMEDFAPSDPTGELRAAEERLRERVENQEA